MRSNGILLAISSLPNKYGVGDFGQAAYDFADILKENNVKIWQILPLNPVGLGNSPYQSICGYAIDTAYIDITPFLKKYKRLYKVIKNLGFENYKNLTYSQVRILKEEVLKNVYNLENRNKYPGFAGFLKKNSWIIDYAHFKVLLRENNNKDWFYWKEEDKNAFYNKEYDYSKFKEEIEYICFEQFIAYTQFDNLHKYLKKLHIKLMGDIPFYVGANSFECWSNQDEFLLDLNDKPSVVAGVPPDYFAKDGQRWGNPIYDWEIIEEDNFDFWNKRLQYSAKMFDILRIDHFRAFDTYYAINADCKTAVDGEWLVAPGKKLFENILPNLKKCEIIAEDLGYLVPTVHELRDYFNFAGMNVIQFSLFDETFIEKENQIIYSGTHDNETLMGYIKNLSLEDRKKVRKILAKNNCEGKNIFFKLLDYIYKNQAKCAIIPAQDVIRIDNKGRMNLPGTCGSPNWEFKLKNLNKFRKNIVLIKELNKKYKR